jgi:RNA polymerase sigma-70 factor (ECF subfamily)
VSIGTVSEAGEAATAGSVQVTDNGDRERLQDYLYRRYRHPLLGYVLPIVNGDRQFAEDVVQETMLRAWRHIDELHPERAGPWLYTVAHNVAISSYHRKKRARPGEVPIEEGTMPVAAEELDGVLDASELQAAMGQLRPEHRAAIVQLYYLQRSVGEVAAALGIPSGTVRSRAFYALRELRAILERRGVTRR